MVREEPRPCIRSKRNALRREMGLVSVFGNHVDAFYGRLLAGDRRKRHRRPIDRFDASKFPTALRQPNFFSSEGYIDRKSDDRLHDCIRYCIVSGNKALEAAWIGHSSKPMEKGSFSLDREVVSGDSEIRDLDGLDAETPSSGRDIPSYLGPSSNNRV